MPIYFHRLARSERGPPSGYCSQIGYNRDYWNVGFLEVKDRGEAILVGGMRANNDIGLFLVNDLAEGVE